jgi:hypothetical protein
MSMSGPLGALPVGPTASTTEVEEDVDGRPHEGHCRLLRQRPPSMLKTLMTAPLGVLPAGMVVSTTNVKDDIDGGSPRGHC